MSDEQGDVREEQEQEQAGNGADAQDEKSAREKVSDGIKEGIGMLSAFKDALEETIQEAKERGDLSAEKAKEAMKDAIGKAQAAAGEARERLEFVSQKDFDSAVDSIRDRLSSLEESVFGASRGGDASASAEDGEDGSAEDSGEEDAPQA